MRSALPTSSYPADWFIEDDEPVAQSIEHQSREFRLQSTLLARARRADQHVLVGCELAFRWDESEPRVGVDPDVYIAVKPPEDDGDVLRVRTWEEGNFPPILAIEIVSRSRPGKDYRDSPIKHDLLGTYELWVFDPEMNGYTDDQAPVLLQVFQRETNNRLVQVHAGEGPFRSDALDAWVMVIDGELVIANDREGKDRWLTLDEEAERRADEEAKRADEEAKRADELTKFANEQAKRADELTKFANEQAKRADELAKHANELSKRLDEERAVKEAALARVAEFEALLARRPG